MLITNKAQYLLQDFDMAKGDFDMLYLCAGGGGAMIFSGFAKSRPAAQRPGGPKAHRPAAHGPRRSRGPAARRPGGPAAQQPGGPVLIFQFFCPAVNPRAYNGRR